MTKLDPSNHCEIAKEEFLKLFIKGIAEGRIGISSYNYIGKSVCYDIFDGVRYVGEIVFEEVIND